MYLLFSCPSYPKLSFNWFAVGLVSQSTRSLIQMKTPPKKQKPHISLWRKQGVFYFTDHFDLSPFSLKPLGSRGYDDTNGLNDCHNSMCDIPTSVQKSRKCMWFGWAGRSTTEIPPERGCGEAEILICHVAFSDQDKEN